MRHDHARLRRLYRWRAAPAMAGLGLLGIAAWGLQAQQPLWLPRAGPAPVLTQPAWTAPVDAHNPALTGRVPAPAGLAGARDRAAAEPAPPMPVVLAAGAQWLRIPSLHLTAAAIPETVHSGVLGVPANPAQVGWWMPTPAELVLDGHVDMRGAGPGALFRLAAMRPGAAVIVQAARGLEHWTVDGIRTYRKGHVPAALFNGLGPRLVIVTCGGRSTRPPTTTTTTWSYTRRRAHRSGCGCRTRPSGEGACTRARSGS